MRKAGERGGGSKAAIGNRKIGRIGRRTKCGGDVAREIGGGAVSSQRLVHLGIEHPGGHLGIGELMGQLRRGIKAGLVIRGANIAIIAKRVVVHIFVEVRIDRSEIRQVKRCVEVDRRAGQVGIPAFHVKLGVVAQLRHDAAIKAPDFLIVHNLGVKIGVGEEAVGLAIIAGENKANAVGNGASDIGVPFPGVLFGIAAANAALDGIAGLQRLDGDGTGSSVPAI